MGRGAARRGERRPTSAAFPACTRPRATRASPDGPRPRARNAHRATELEVDPRYDACEPGYATFIEALGEVYCGDLDRYVELTGAVARAATAAIAGYGLAVVRRRPPVVRSGRRGARAHRGRRSPRRATLGNPYWISYTLWIAGWPSRRPTRSARSPAWDEGVAFVREHRVHFFEGFLARDAARLHTSDGEPEAALVLFADAIAAFHRAGNVPQLIITLASVPALFERLDRLDAGGDAARRDVARAVELPPRSRARRPRRLASPSSSGETTRRRAHDGRRGARPRTRRPSTRGQQIDVARRDPSRGHAPARPGGLSRREIEVLRLVADGRTAGEIATQLFISARTADHHIQHIYTKIGVSSRAAATRWAVEHDVVDTPVTLTFARNEEVYRCRGSAPIRTIDPTPTNRRRAGSAGSDEREIQMILATTTVEDVDRFLDVFGTKGADKRALARLEGLDGLPRPHRGEPGLGAVRLGRGGLAELRLRPRGAADPQGSRPPGKPQAALLLGTYQA